MKKKIIYTLLCIMALSLAGCKSNDDDKATKVDNEVKESVTEVKEVEFPREYNKVDGNVTFACKVEAPETAVAHEYTAKLKTIDNKALYNQVCENLQVESHEQYETGDGGVADHLYGGDEVSVSISATDVRYVNHEYTEGLYEAFRIHNPDSHSNIDLFLNDKNLDFNTQEEIKEIFYEDLCNVGYDNLDLRSNIYVCDMETLEAEYQIDTAYYDEIGVDYSEFTLHEGYYICARQKLDDIPVFVSDILYQDCESNAPISAFYTKDGVQELSVGDIFEFDKGDKSYNLLSFEEVAEKVSAQYNYYITENEYQIYSANLYYYVHNEQSGVYEVSPVWIFKLNIIYSDGEYTSQTQIEIEADTGEVFARD